MKSLGRFLAMAAFMAPLWHNACAAPHATDASWVGVWGYVVAPGPVAPTAPTPPAAPRVFRQLIRVSADHLHPNDAGYKAMTDAVDLAVLGK